MEELYKFHGHCSIKWLYAVQSVIVTKYTKKTFLRFNFYFLIKFQMLSFTIYVIEFL